MTLRRPALLCATCLFILATWEIAVLFGAARGAPRDADWAAAERAVRGQFQPGDLIVFAPAWVDPIGRKWLGDLMTVEDAARMDDARYARVWEVSIRGASAGVRGAVASDERFGAVRVRRLERTAARVSFDLRERAHLFEVDYTPRLCVPLRPPGRLELAQAPLARRLAVSAGIADFRSRRDNRARALLSVLIDGTEVTRAEIGNDSGWLPLPDAATTPGPHTVVLESQVAPSTPGASPAKLDLCVALEARDP